MLKNIPSGTFMGSDIENGTFHGSEVEPGVFHCGLLPQHLGLDDPMLNPAAPTTFGMPPVDEDQALSNALMPQG